MSCVFVCVLHLKTLERKRDTENGGETCDTIKRCALCPLAHGYSREQRAHRNPLEEPDYLSALKLIKWVWGSVCVRVCVCVCVWERERDLVVLIFFFSCFFKQILLCFTAPKGRWGREVHGSVWLCSSMRPEIAVSGGGGGGGGRGGGGGVGRRRRRVGVTQRVCDSPFSFNLQPS